MRVKFPLQVGQGEAINVEFALTLLRGQSLYHDPSQAPYLYSAYPPLYPWLQSLLMKFTQNIWLPGRLLAFTGYLGCGSLIFFWGKGRWGWPLALLLSSLFGLFPTWALWGTMDRCDAFYLLLHFSAFLLLYGDDLQDAKDGSGNYRRAWLIPLAGILAAFAILTKQNALTLPLVYGIYCLSKRQWKKIFIFLFFSLLPTGAVFYFEDWKSGGAFLKHIFLWLDTGINGENLGYYLFHLFLKEGGVLLAIAALLLCFKRPVRLLLLQVFFSFLSLLLLARAMSAENYFMEFLLYGIFFIGEGLVAPAREDSKGFRSFRTSIPITLFCYLLLGALYASLSHMRWPNLPSGPEINMKYDAAVEIYAKPGEHLALDLDLPLMAGKRIWVQPGEYTAMVAKGLWSAEPLLEEIRAKKYSTIELYDIPRQYLLPDLVVEEILKNYHVSIRRFGRLWLVPNRAQS